LLPLFAILIFLLDICRKKIPFVEDIARYSDVLGVEQEVELNYVNDKEVLGFPF